MDGIETATDSLERHKHLQEHPENRHARRVALLIGILAAMLAICEMGERSAQNNYLARQIMVNDDWGFYQAKGIKSDIANMQAAVLGAMAKVNSDPALVAASKASAKRAATLQSDATGKEGKAQLYQKALTDTKAEEHQLERYHRLELIVGTLQIAIVLGSVSVVTEIVGFSIASAVIGGLAFLGGIAVMALL